MVDWNLKNVAKTMDTLAKPTEKVVDTNKVLTNHIAKQPQGKQDPDEYDTTIVDETTGDFMQMKVRKEKAVELKVYRPNELQQRLGLKMLTFGQPKTGKTTICMKSPEPNFIIDTENGIKPLISLYKDKDMYIYDIVRTDETTFDIDEVGTIDALKLALGDIRNKVTKYYEETGKTPTVCIDSMTTIWDILLMWLNIQVLKQGGKINSKQVPSSRFDWRKLNSLYSGMMTQLMNLPANVILVAQVKDSSGGDEMIDGATVSSGSVEAPKVQKWTPYQVDVVLKTFHDKSSNKYWGQVWMTRYPELKPGELLQNPTVESILKLIEERRLK